MDKNYQIELKVTDPETNHHISAKLDRNLVQDLYAMHNVHALVEAFNAIIEQFKTNSRESV